MNTVSLNIRLVPKGFAAVTDPRRIPARSVPFVWSEGERTWRSVEPLFVTAAKREGEGAYRAVSELADGPFYHTALRIGGTVEDTAATLQRRIDSESLVLVAPQRWACLDCQRSFKKEKDAGPCARHQKEMPPAVLYKTTHPRVNRLGQYYVFGWARDFESTTPIFEHNDEIWNPNFEQVDSEREALRATERLAAEQRAQEQAAYDALSPAERQAAFERALFGEEPAGAAAAEGDGLASASMLVTGKGSLVARGGMMLTATDLTSSAEIELDRIKGKNHEEVREAAESFFGSFDFSEPQVPKGIPLPTSLPDGAYPFAAILRCEFFVEDHPFRLIDFSNAVKIETEIISFGPALGVAPEFAPEVTRICNILRTMSEAQVNFTDGTTQVANAGESGRIAFDFSE